MTAMRLKRYPSPSGGFALGKVGVGATMMRSILPAGARWVEYLKSTGTQWIDTGIYPTTMMRWRLDIQFVGSANFMAMGSIYPGTPRERFIIGREGNDKLNISYGAPDNPTSVLGRGERHTMILDAKNLSWSIDGTSGSFAEASIDNVARMFLFVRNRSTTKTGVSLDAPCINTYIYSCQIYQNDTPVRDFRPIAIGTTGYMLDLVSGEYLPYGNKGTGDFVIGPDINAPAI